MQESTPWLGVVTVQSIEHSSHNSVVGSCGLIKWCYSWLELVNAPFLAGTAEVAVLTNDESFVRASCSVVRNGRAQPRIIAFDPTLPPLIKGWRTALNYTRDSWYRTLSLHALYKLQLWSLTRYRAVLFTDADVDPFLSSRGRPGRGAQLQHAFTDSLRSFIASDVQLTASSDYHSPINTAVMLLKPNTSVFARGLAVLRRRRFDRRLGFDLVGRPRDALAHLRAHPSWPLINHTRMLVGNDWDFIGGWAPWSDIECYPLPSIAIDCH